MKHQPYKNYQQCARCVMDTTDAEITFDTNGHCNHCTDFLEKKSKLMYQGPVSDKVLSQIIEDLKEAGKDKKYDCVLGISGGADSCYTAYMCKQLGLRVLLVHVDNAWNSKTATENIENISRKLEFDLETYVLNWEEFRDLQLSFLKASVPELETPTDIAILGGLHRSAAKYNIKHIIMGGNYVTEGILPKSWHYDAKDLKYMKAIHKKFGKVKLTQFPTFSFSEEIYYKLIRGIKIVYLLNQTPYSKQDAIKLLEKLGWQYYGQKHHESFYTRIVQSFILPAKFNIDYRRPNLSVKVCTAEISREDALKLLSEKPYNEISIKNDTDYVCKKLGITVGEFDESMKAVALNHRDYPNNQKLLKLLYKLYRIINGIPAYA